ncbi:ABC transporter ATP-binding protein [Pseudomonas sp. Q11]|uniref:ATP-binding cassette domain-containing protein n=1 Tax=Pseudomonas sp. Q11 TaxID=2968470 RepID=UPI00210B8CE4|nr:ABC transporter ATP-binding protein [Pseudomonas sp. Q11]MCQ6260222.1 ABC transporter ATP-binding protein/permease [Pseudomonas sp. Q11]
MLNREFLSAGRICWGIVRCSSVNIRLSFVIACLLDLITVFMSVAAPAILKLLVDSLSSAKTPDYIVWLGAAYGLTWLGAELLLRLRGVVAGTVVEKIKFEATRRFCLNSIFKLTPDFKDLPSGIFATKLNQTNASLPMFIDGLVWQIFPLLVRLFLSVSMLIQVVPSIYASLLAVTIIGFMIVSFFSYKSVGERQKHSNISSQKAYWKIMDALKNKTIIIAHGAEGKEFKHVESSLLASTKSAIGVVSFSQAISALQVMLLGIGLTAITVLSVRDLSGGIITIGDFVQINAYVLQFVLPVSYVGMVLSAIKRSSVTIAENAEHLVSSDLDFNDRSKVKCTGAPAIILDKVSVKSAEGSFLLKDISLSIGSGSSLAVVGKSGSGKSTFAKAILGLAELSSGVIKFDSHDSTCGAIRTFRENSGYVPQESLLFDRSVKNNVFSSEFLNRNKISHILRISGVDESVLEYNASSLSGGEKQRVSFARAIARNSGVLILDEPTSSLDNETKSILSSAVYDIFTASTRITITHDLEEASKAQSIIVMNDGEIVEFGTHQELIESGGWYSEHWKITLLARKKL